MKKVLVALVLASVLLVTMIVPTISVGAFAGYPNIQTGWVDVDHNGTMDYFYQTGYFKEHVVGGFNYWGWVSFYTDNTESVLVGSQGYLNGQGMVNNTFYPVENPDYIFPFSFKK